MVPLYCYLLSLTVKFMTS
ncbi:hypothetical protein E2C01_079702 [Portunus trituberculatus]|uniref:Uncharacterized protein n=1 Tax=Portunus trituberculatus TaxID=210409 RepID=A0A5B7IWB6_PORTR|nr:hypothetical protein [Portunus trituberculatus]